jgi:hypothetical protein
VLGHPQIPDEARTTPAGPYVCAVARLKPLMLTDHPVIFTRQASSVNAERVGRPPEVVKGPGRYGNANV